jgi:hypothetical protein
MDRASVMAWVAEYERSWRDGDLAAVQTLFTPDARYRVSPYEPAKVGHDQIRAFWLDDEGETSRFWRSPWPSRGVRRSCGWRSGPTGPASPTRAVDPP